MISSFYAHGKLLLTSEYVVLDGALALALPTQKGQKLEIKKSDLAPGTLLWKSYDHENQVWFEMIWNILSRSVLRSSDEKIAANLAKILNAVETLHPGFPAPEISWEVNSRLEFPATWGLGSSSTLIATLAEWANVDAFVLLNQTIGGSGYDIACAHASGPIFFRLENGHPVVETVPFQPNFSEQLIFVYQEKKQSSKEGIYRYQERKTRGIFPNIQAFDDLTKSISKASTLKEFEEGIQEHEIMISKLIDLPPVKTSLFPDYPGAIKSLGAWGGDFLIATCPDGFEEGFRYFQEKGFSTVFQYDKIIL
jgi:mevalonate kinase